MLSGIGKLKVEHLIGALVAALVASAAIADINVQQRSDNVFSGDGIRWFMLLFGAGALALLTRVITERPRGARLPHHFLGVWVVGQATIIGLVQTLPTPPTLETIQTIDLRSLDPFAQAALQWGAGWTVLVLLTFVFAGPPLNLGWALAVWLAGVSSSAVVAQTLPEDALPPLVLLPMLAVWAAVVYIGTVYSQPTPAPDPWRPLGARPVTRAVWASLALVMLGLCLAEFQSFVALDQQVNADRTVTQRAMDGVASGIDRIDQNVTATAKAVRARGDIKGSIETIETSIIDVSDEVQLVQEAQQISSTSLAHPEQAGAVVDRVVKANDGLQALLIPLGTLNPDTDRDQLTLLLDRDVPRAIANARREAHLAQQVLVGNELPTAGVFLWVAATYAALVLLPWVLFVLFLLQKRESRARESLVDLCLLDGRPAPERAADAPFGDIQPGSLLDRVLGEGFRPRPQQNASGPTVGQVQSALVQRAFSEPEYLIGLVVLTGVIAAGWYMVFYPKGGVGLAETIVQGADSAHLWAYVLSGLNPLTAAFAGAYFWCVYALVRRYLDSDLYPAAFLQCSVQFVLALVLSLMIAIGVPPVASLATGVAGFIGDSASGLGNHLTGTNAASAAAQATQAGPLAVSTIDAITMLLAFLGGVSISAGFTQVLSLLRVLLKYIGLRSEQPSMDQPRLTELEGIDSWTEARFAEEGIDNIQALANAPLARLVIRTHFTTPRVVDWVDQSLLYLHTANWPLPADQPDAVANGQTAPSLAPAPANSPPRDGRSDLFRALRFAGIRTATDLLGAGGWLKMATYVDLGDAVARQETLQQALRRVVSNDPAFAAAVFTACQALIEAPNWAHVANFRRATRDLLGADTRGWIQPVNPPVLPLGAAPANALPAETPHPATV